MESHLEKGKFYVPEISEFHVGFEFEDSTNDKEEDWVQWYIADTNDLIQALDVFDLHNCRVKRLDRDDIESLGWEHNNEGRTISDSFFFKNIECIEYKLRLWNNQSVDVYSEDTDSTYFDGTIKNKSELKRILKQLEI